MTFPFNFELFGFTVSSHLAFELLAYTLGFNYYLYLKRRAVDDPLSAEQRFSIIIGGAVGALIFSKVVGLLEHPALVAHAGENILYLLGSKTIVGGLLGGILGVEITKKILKVTHSSGDLFCFPIIFGMAIGRIGCFLTGVEDGTHGLPTDSVFGMDLGDGVRRHPTALYEIFVLLAIAGLLVIIRHNLQLTSGALFKIFMVSYLMWRFGVEFIKPVYRYEPLGLSTIQVACLLGLLYYHKVILRPLTLLRRREQKWPRANTSTTS